VLDNKTDYDKIFLDFANKYAKLALNLPEKN
jgi:hypothetical protein